MQNNKYDFIILGSIATACGYIAARLFMESRATHPRDINSLEIEKATFATVSVDADAEYGTPVFLCHGKNGRKAIIINSSYGKPVAIFIDKIKSIGYTNSKNVMVYFKDYLSKSRIVKLKLEENSENEAFFNEVMNFVSK